MTDPKKQAALDALDNFVRIFKLHAGIKEDFKWEMSSFGILEATIRAALTSNPPPSGEGVVEALKWYAEPQRYTVKNVTFASHEDGSHSQPHQTAIEFDKGSRARKALSTIPAQSDWMPIDTAPRDGTWIFLSPPASDNEYIHVIPAVGRFSDDRKWHDNRGYEFHETYIPKYWQPLPQAPKGEKS